MSVITVVENQIRWSIVPLVSKSDPLLLTLNLAFQSVSLLLWMPHASPLPLGQNIPPILPPSLPVAPSLAHS